MNPAPPVIKTRMAAAEATGCGMFRAWGPFPRDGACATSVRCSPCEGRWSHRGDPRHECRRKREAKAYPQQGDRRPGAFLASGAACFWRIAPRNGGLRRRHTAEVFDGKDHCAGKSNRNRDDEEKEAGRERGLLLDPELRQEADEEGLAHGEPVDREGNE